MIKFNYPDDSNFLDEYYKIFNFATDQENKWNSFVISHPKKNSYLPQTLKELLICPPLKILEIFTIFSKKKYKKKELKSISFIDYEKNNDKIIDFFLMHKDKLDISTCCYCNLSYVNIFQNKNEKELLDILNSPDDGNIISLFKRANVDCSPSMLKKIKKNQPYSSIEDFDKLDKRWNGKKSLQLSIMQQQFDLDHFLPKSECFLISLSLNNLVPSCQVCNSRIKLANYIKKAKLQERHFPTSKNYNYENELEFSLWLHKVPELEFSSHPDYFSLHIDEKKKNSIYMEEAELFRIQDRYQYHICEVLRYVDNQRFFNKFYTRMMLNNLINDETLNNLALLKEIICNVDFKNENKRIMSKLFNDIKKQFEN